MENAFLLDVRPEAADPWGHQWTFSETLEDVHPETWGGILLAPE